MNEQKPQRDQHPTEGNESVRLDKLKLMYAKSIFELFTIDKIRKNGLDNLTRWESQGVWNAGYEDWRIALQSAPDDHIKYLLTSSDEEPANRLRQSLPFTGLLPEHKIETITAAWKFSKK